MNVMKRIFAVIVGVFLAGVACAQVAFPSLEPIFTYTPQRAVLTGEDVIRAGLEFSLCPQDSAQGTQVLKKYRELEDIVTSAAYQALTVSERGEKILALMYERVLNQYVSNQTKIDTLFAEGTYNCVSASVLYFALARAAGLNVAGQETPNHAFCTIYDNGKKIDVETTNPGGFNPGTKKVVEQTANSTRYFLVPKKYYSGRREVGERKFVSLVGRNLVAAMNDKNDYEQGVPLSCARIVFTNGTAAKDTADVRADFDTIAGNFAVVLDQQRSQSARALDWLDAVYARWGQSAALQKTYDTIAYNCAVNYLKGKDYASAREQFETHKVHITAKNAAQIDVMIVTAYIDDTVQPLSADEAIAFLHAQRETPIAKDRTVSARLNEHEEYYWYQKLKPLFDGGDYLAAAALADQGLTFVPSSRNLKTVRNQCYQNYAIDVHNEFADLANMGRYDEALHVVQKGLQVNPTNTTLKNDLKKIESFLQSR